MLNTRAMQNTNVTQKFKMTKYLPEGGINKK